MNYICYTDLQNIPENAVLEVVVPYFRILFLRVGRSVANNKKPKTL
jgi:hypothetical protein